MEVVNVCYRQARTDDIIGKPEDMSSGLSMMALNIRKAFINARRVNSAKFGYEAHFMSFAAIVASRNGTEGSN